MSVGVLVDTSDVAAPLLAWYAFNKRPLPWRTSENNPYAIWISEIMSQQTTIAAVIPYFIRWMDSFPTINSLARARLEDVLVHWQGLGYYARARNIHKASQQIVNEYGGRIPSDINHLRSLPGIGQYTAGAILSVAYNQDIPVLDANVTRVISRVFCVPGDPKRSATQKILWQLAEQLLPHGNAGDFNQSLMELGALVCSPVRPQCCSCPIKNICGARAKGIQERYPEFAAKTAKIAVDDTAVAVYNGDGQILLVNRPSEWPLWGGLWEMPRVTRAENESLLDSARRALFESARLQVTSLELFGSVKHVVANRKITLYGYKANLNSSVIRESRIALEHVWTTCDTLVQYPIASPHRRLIEKLKSEKVQSQFTL